MTRRTHHLIASTLATFALTTAATALASPDAAQARSTQTPSTGVVLSIPIHTPAGDAVRLVYAAGNGWRTLSGQNDLQPVQKTAASAASESAVDPETPPSVQQPMSVFVDGPTGYVFVWTADGPGWNFVGQIDEQRQ